MITDKEIKISFKEYSSLDEMEMPDRELTHEAINAMRGSYSPYSHFHVGAAVRLSDGTMVRGANQENAAYPSGTCAERSAMFAAGSQHPDKDIISIAVAGGPEGVLSDYPASPCGACRQVMAQYQTKAGKPMSVILVGRNKIWKFSRVDDILPLIFNNI